MNTNKPKITEIPYDSMENVDDKDSTKDAFEFWFYDEIYGTISFRYEWFLEDVYHKDKNRLIEWLEAAFQVGYTVGKYGVQRSKEESPPKEEANREIPIRDNSLD